MHSVLKCLKELSVKYKGQTINDRGGGGRAEIFRLIFFFEDVPGWKVFFSEDKPVEFFFLEILWSKIFLQGQSW